MQIPCEFELSETSPFSSGNISNTHSLSERNDSFFFPQLSQIARGVCTNGEIHSRQKENGRSNRLWLSNCQAREDIIC